MLKNSEKPEANVIGETLNTNTAHVENDQDAKEEKRTQKLRYLRILTGSDLGTDPSSDRNVQRLVDDPHFDVFFQSSSQFCLMVTNQQKHEDNN